MKMKKYLKSVFDHTFFKKIKLKLFLLKNAKKTKLNDKEYLTKVGKIFYGRKFSLDNPQTFNEKINWYKLNYFDEKMKYVVDKANVKNYVIEKGFDDILIKTIKIYDSIDEINIDDLPNKFVIKNTCDSESVIVCRNKNEIKLNDIKAKLSKIDKVIVNGKHFFREKVYENQKNKIIVEELIETDDNRAPIDYKFFCFMGEPFLYFIASNRDKELNIDYFDMNCKKLPITRVGHKNSTRSFNKPEKFEEMVNICRSLSKDFPFVRVDLYNEKGRIYFGELTFYNSAGFAEFKPKKWDYILGNYIDIEKIKNFKSNQNI